jgi:lupus La protein
LVGGIENKPVPLTELCKFKRMQRFQPFEAVVEALKESDQVELTDDNTAVRRKKPLEEDFFKVIPGKSDPRTVYVKGFGEETPSSQFDIEAFFDPYGPTKAVRLRRNDEKTFKGSVFVEFETEALAEAFLALDPKPKYKDRDLQIMSKTEYTAKKEEDLKAGRIISNQDDRRGAKQGNREQQGSRDHGKRNRDRDDDRDWRTRRDEDQKRGFRDDKRRGDRDRGSRGGRGGRPEWRGGGRSKAPETDER